MIFPRATYRLQLNHQFPVESARKLLPFLERLGISDLYVSPPFGSRPGSMHGYDQTDPAAVNPEIGGEEQFTRLAAELHQRGMGLVVDIVPNHMAASSGNRWWMDVLEHGLQSQFAGYFDVEWGSPGADNPEKILLPTLGDPFGTALEYRHIRLGIDESGFAIHYFSIRLPVDPRTYPLILEDLPATKEELLRLYTGDAEMRARIDARIEEINGRDGDPRSLDSLEALLHEQPYRLAWWQNARERVNYRRFFDVSDLIGLRQENPEVFAATHRLICEWVQEGVATGLRVDHVDGLFAPRQYLERLKGGCGTRPYIVVEKILLGDEQLPREWPVDGTTGYDFLGMTNNLFVDGANLPALQESYTRITGLSWTLDDVAIEQKRWIIRHLFRGEMFALGLHLGIIAELDRHGRDLSPQETRKALVELTACLPVYRTYIEGETVSSRDRDVIARAVGEARGRNTEISEATWRFLERVLLLTFPAKLTPEQRADWVQFVMRWQQLTGPIAAKGGEDTAMYLYNRLISMNDVGGQSSAVTPDRYHRFNAARRERWPGTMNTLSTHDTKRSADVRARLNVLSEISGEWGRALMRWSRWNRDKKAAANAPDGNEEVLLYQTMLGAWPLHPEEEPAFVERLKAYMVKAVREAKVYSSWIKPNEEHEQSIHRFIDAILDPAISSRFLQHFDDLRQKLAWYGMLNSLSQTLLMITAPGVPDFYQGTELLDFSLVDPDNRRPVNVEARLAMADEIDAWEPQRVLADWRNGRVKAFMIRRALERRVDGDYLPVETGTEQAFAFARRLGDRWTLTVVPRFVSRLSGVGKLPAGGRVWKDAALQMPEGAPRRWTNAFTGETVTSGRLADILRGFPVALLYN